MKKRKNSMKQIVAGLLLAWSGVAFAERATPPVGVELVDLTDDLENRASITGNDNLNNSKGELAFDIIGDVPTEIAKWGKTANDNTRFGGTSRPLKVIYEFKTPQIVDAYRIYNQHKDGWSFAERSPREFYLEGSQTGADDSWVVLDSENETEEWGGLEARYFEFINLTAYKFYRLRLESANRGDGSGDWLVIQELELFSRSRKGLMVVGEPGAYGNPTPKYGLFSATEGETIDLSVESLITIEEGKRLAVCTGWTAYDESDDGSYVQREEGVGNVAQFVYSGGNCKWAWHFEVSNRVETATLGDGSITIPNNGWGLEGSQMELKAEPKSGFRFYRWTGDTEGLGDIGSPTIAIVCDKPKSLNAVFVPEEARQELYVSPNGDDEYSGYTVEQAKKTIGAAIDSLESLFGDLGGTVFVQPGTYQVTNMLYLTNAIAVVGTTGNPSDVIVRNTKDVNYANQTHRVFAIRHGKAIVSGLTISGGRVYSQGGNVSITGEGGMVSNCWIQSGMARSPSARGGGVYLDSQNALVTHCKIEDSSLGHEVKGEVDGVAAYVKKGTVANSLIVGNAAEVTWQYAAASNMCVVRVLQGSLVNCTVVNNCHTGLVAAVRSSHGDARVVNCVMAGTRTTDGVSTNAWTGENASTFINCVTDDKEPINSTCRVGTVDEMFVNYERGNYQPKLGGPLHDTGTIANITVPSVDFAGAPRVVGKGLDIGCYESQKTVGFKLIIR